MLALASSPANAALITLEGDSFPQAELYVDGQFAGVMGDTLDLSSGEHTISFAGPHAYEFRVVVAVTESIAAKPDRPSRFDDCINGRVSRAVLRQWPAPALQPTYSGATIRLGKPLFEDRGDQGNCMSEPSLIKLQQLGKITLSASSNPMGAEVWVKGSKVATTNSSIVIPYTNADRKLIQVVIRKSGYANCLRKIQPPSNGDSAQRIECILERTS